MLKGFLPFKRTPPQENPQELQSNSYASDLNLLGRREYFNKDRDIRYHLVLFFQICICVISIAFLVLLIVSKSYNAKLSSLKKDTDALVEQVSTYSNDIAESRLIAAKLRRYSEIQAARKSLSRPIGKVLEIAQAHVTILDFAGTTEKFKLSAEAEDATGIVSMLYELLKSGELTQLSLKSVDYQPARSIYSILLEGYYK